jgi:uncharacterized membrane protein YjgN (DUF898 family)
MLAHKPVPKIITTAGFTAWSSVREPSQVFTLLETLFHSFDGTAKRRRVFKGKFMAAAYFYLFAPYFTDSLF